jgi:hypothetical protein
MNRREFLNLSACSAMAGLSGCATGRSIPVWTGTEKIKALLLHLGHNMWCEWLPDEMMKSAKITERYVPDLVLRNQTELWNQVTNHAAERKLNMIVIDIGEGLVYPSHPELAIEGSWTPDRLREEIIRLRGLGLEAIPKLNFSATHDGWLKHYHRMLTLPEYYSVVKDLIRDVAEIFQTPRFFHLGYDEETASYSKNRNYFVMRAGDMWWHDFLYTVRCVEDCGCRPWVWSDYGWHHEDYFTRCPKSVVQSDWYYDECNADFSLDEKKNGHWFRLKEIDWLEKAGFDQIPCGTNWVGSGRRRDGVNAADVIGKLVKFGREHISDRHLLGFMMAPWACCSNEASVLKNINGIDLFADALEGKIAKPEKLS